MGHLGGAEVMGVEDLWLELGIVKKDLEGVDSFCPGVGNTTFSSFALLSVSTVMRLLPESRAAHPDTEPASFCFWTSQNCDK